jgi:ABC-type sulfate transport system substrate-binding protein
MQHSATEAGMPNFYAVWRRMHAMHYNANRSRERDGAARSVSYDAERNQYREKNILWNEEWATLDPERNARRQSVRLTKLKYGK